MLSWWNRYWEGLCRKCGLCCYAKSVYADNVMYHMDMPCRDFSLEDHTCRIYETRFKDNRECRKMTIIKAMFASYLHESCGYVQWAKRSHLRFAGKYSIFFLGDEDS